MRTNVSGTSIHSYHTEIKGKKEDSQDNIILNVIKEHGPCTARMIQDKTRMEINCVSRSLNNLWPGNTCKCQ